MPLQPTRCRSRRPAPAAAWLVLLAVPVLFLAGPSFLSAQPAGAAPVEAEAGLGAFTMAGDDFPEIGGGPSVDAGLRAWPSPRFSVGAGFHHSWHSAPRLSTSLRVLSLHMEPRFHLPHLPGVRVVHPFLGVRAGYARWEAREGDGRIRAEVSADGLQAAGVAGVSVPIRPGLALDLALEAGYLRFGDARVEARLQDASSPRIRRPPDSDTEGLLLGVRSSLRTVLPWP